MTHWLTADGPHTAEAEAFARYGRIRVPAEAGDAPAGRPPVRLVEQPPAPSRAVRAFHAAQLPFGFAIGAAAFGVWWMTAMFGIAAALFAAFEMPWADDR